MGQSVIESVGAVIPARRNLMDEHSGRLLPVSAQSNTPRSFMTAIRADLGEAEAYKAALLRGEIGLQRPMGANVAGADFITAIRVGRMIKEIVCSDVKTTGTGQFPRAKTILPGTWRTEAQDAASPPRLRLAVIVTDVAETGPFGRPDPTELTELEEGIMQALAAGRIRPEPRQLNANFSPAGRGDISGW